MIFRLFFQESFTSKVRSKARNKRVAKKSDENNSASLVLRHASILGLCAYVNAYPYTVPESVPDVLMILSDHLHDPQPIPVSFLRTNFYLYNRNDLQSY